VVLEAETLIEDYLADEGKSRYIIDDDDSFKISKIIAFLNKMISLNAKIHLNFSSPLDPFGNEVDENGNSIDKNGKIIDKKRYLYENGKPVDDLQRDRAYTEILSNEILKAYKKNNIILSVNFVSYIAFKLFEKQHQKIDFYKFIKEPTIDLSIKLNNFYKESDILLNKLHKMHKKKELVLSDILIEGKSEEILADALRFSNSMSTTPPLYRKGIRLYSDNLKVLYYYHNRLANYKL
jgi:glycerol-3-phosphate O-acyltransferase